MNDLVSPRQKVPSAYTEREALRTKGQFWTPGWLAGIMAEWATQNSPDCLFDPAVGPGTFFVAARQHGYAGSIAGCEVDPDVLALAKEHGLKEEEMRDVKLEDFITCQPTRTYPAIISNPPYVRHHRLGEDRKRLLRELAKQSLGFELDGRTGLHVYFLLKCLESLQERGRLAFLLPADVCESVSSSALWRRLAEKFRINAVLRFQGDACPFPGVDTNALVFLISRDEPSKTLLWLNIDQPDSASISEALISGKTSSSGIKIWRRKIDEALVTGLSREPRSEKQSGARLNEFATVVRGIATGANEFFFLTTQQLEAFDLPKSFFIRAIGRTRDNAGGELTTAQLEKLDAEGRPTWLLNLADQPAEALPASLQNYLKSGVSAGLRERALIRTRRPWYRMEKRQPPSLLFAYLGRRDCRFIMNRAGAVPLTGFLCVYPDDTRKESIERLWMALNHPLTLANLSYVGKSYGGGALKVEPRQLDQLLIPDAILEQYKLKPRRPQEQLQLLESAHDEV